MANFFYCESTVGACMEGAYPVCFLSHVPKVVFEYVTSSIGPCLGLALPRTKRMALRAQLAYSQRLDDTNPSR